MQALNPFTAIVDDEEPVRRALVRLLRSAGFEARAFASGVEFLNSLASQKPSCVVLDLHMPAMSGLDVQERLANVWPGLPVIFITGHQSVETEARVRAARPLAFLLKPIHDRLLLDAVASVMKSGAA